MRRSTPLPGLLAGFLALVVFTAAAVAMATGEPSGPRPPRLPAVAGAPVAAAAADPARTDADADADADARTIVAADGDGDGRGFGGRGRRGDDFGGRGGVDFEDARR